MLVKTFENADLAIKHFLIQETKITTQINGANVLFYKGRINSFCTFQIKCVDVQTHSAIHCCSTKKAVNILTKNSIKTQYF